MMPMLNDRLSMIATAATVALMFFSFAWLLPALNVLDTTYVIAGGAAAIVASFGVYRLLADGLLLLFKQIRFLRRLLLGKAFIEGTWVGHYERNGEHRFTVEYIDQASGAGTVIRGREFDAAGRTRSTWSSDTVSIDTVRMQLVYAYTCKVFGDGQKHVQEGFAFFAMVCGADDEPAGFVRTAFNRLWPGPAKVCKLDGYATDLTDCNRDPNTEHKIRDTETSDEYALARARNIFKVPEPGTTSTPAVRIGEGGCFFP